MRFINLRKYMFNKRIFCIFALLFGIKYSKYG
jgi:hypothetical protein